MLPLPSVLRRGLACATVLSALGSGAALAADTPNYCVAVTTSNCPAAVDDAHRVTSFARLNTKLSSDSAPSFTNVIVEPGTYSEAVDFKGPTDMSIFGDPNGATVPVITSADATATVTEETGAGGLKLSHLVIHHTGAAGAAYTATNRFGLSDIDIESTGAGISGIGSGSETLTDVGVTSTAAAGTATGTPLIDLEADATVTLSDVAAHADDRATGILLRSGQFTADRILSTAHGLDGGKGGYGLLITGEAGSSPLPSLKLSHASLAGGAFGAAAFGADMDMDNSLATSDGAPVGPVTVGPYTVTPPFGPAAIASGAASTTDLANVTAFAAGTTSDGIVANSARGKADDDPFAYRAFIRSSNSIFRGGHLDVEATPEVGFDDPNDIAYRARIGTANDNFVTLSGPTEAILGDTTDQVDDPMFVNPVPGAAADFHVKNGSRTLGAGTTISDVETDLDGKARPDTAGGHADLGAYESTGTAAGPGTPQPAFATGGDGGGQPSNAFSVAGSKVAKSGAITFALAAPSAGTFRATATTKIKVKVRVKKGRRHVIKTKTKTVTFAKGSATATAGATVALTLKPSGAAAKGLKGGKREKVAVTITFSPTGGTPAKQAQTVTVRKG